MKSKYDHTGERFGAWNVLYNLPGNSGYYMCRCSCGIERKVKGGSLRKGKSSGCGKAVCCPGKYARNKPPGESIRNTILQGYKRGATRRGYVWDITDTRAIELFSLECFYCGSPPSNIAKYKGLIGSFTYNGIDRFERTGLYDERSHFKRRIEQNR